MKQVINEAGLFSQPKEVDMRLSRSTGYALLGIGYIAEHQKDGIVLSQSISEEYDIPLEYLLKILQQLVRASLLRSKRGPRGGFVLAKPTNKITLLEVVEAVEGPVINRLTLSDLPNTGRYAQKIEKVYDKALEQAKGVLAKTKLSTLLTK